MSSHPAPAVGFGVEIAYSSRMDDIFRPKKKGNRPKSPAAPVANAANVKQGSTKQAVASKKATATSKPVAAGKPALSPKELKLQKRKRKRNEKLQKLEKYGVAKVVKKKKRGMHVGDKRMAMFLRPSAVCRLR